MKTVIYEYLDYREYLRAVFAEKKAENTHFSHRTLADRLGIKAPGHMLFVMQGKRKLTEPIGLRLAEYLKFKKAETAYLLNLIKFNNAKQSGEKQYAFDLLQSARRRTASVVAPDRHSFYERWYYSAIRASLDAVPFKDDFASLARSLRPPVTPQQAKEAVGLLESLGFIKKDAGGFFRVTEPKISTGTVPQSAVIKHLHYQLIELASQSLDRFSPAERDISGLTITVSPASLEKVRECIKNARAEILEIAASEEAPDRVLQCNFQLFPVFIRYRGRQG